MRLQSQHHPIIETNAARYILLLTLALAITVVVTRLYLDITGYPQIGNGTFHFAHALWGGLLQTIAAVLLLLFANRWFKDLSAVIAGVGIGLFIDEVGKFITQQNDYFFPLAAPIIYVTFLLTVFIYLLARRQTAQADSRAKLVGVLHDLEEVVDGDLSGGEKNALLAQLRDIRANSSQPEYVTLAEQLTAYLESSVILLKPDQPSRLDKFLQRVSRFETRVFSQQRTRRILVSVFLLSSLATALLVIVLAGVLLDAQTVLTDLLQVIVLDEANVASAYSASWFLAMALIQIITGTLVFASAIAFLRHRDRRAITLGLVAVVITLTITNTLSFYFNQFSVVLNSLAAFGLFILLKRYRDRFLGNDPVDATAAA